MVWRPVAERLRATFHCLAYDGRGHGDSAVDPSAGARFDWHALAGDALAVVDGLRLDRPFGLGHSSGASVLLLAEAMRPGTFTALYCIEPVGAAMDDPPPPMPDHPMAEQARRRREVFASRQEAEDAYRAKPPLSAVAPESLRAYVEHGFADQPDGTVRLKCRGENEARMYEHGFAHDAYRRLGQVPCPVVVARGGRSFIVDAKTLERWAARLPSGRAEVLEGLGHLAPLEAPDVVARAVRRAFTGLLRPG